MKWAFSDESRRTGVMFVGVALVETHELHAARRAMSALLLPRQRRLHLTDERVGRRKQILSAVSALPIEALVLRVDTGARSITHARRQLLDACVTELVDRGVEKWTLDGVEAIQRDRDRATISAALARTDAQLLYDHEPAVAEPLLWVADAVSWAAGSSTAEARALTDRCAVLRIDP